MIDSDRVNRAYNGAWLHDAVRRGDIGTVKTLLQNGADPNLLNADGWTALHYAALHGDIDTVRLFLEHKADYDKPTVVGNTPLLLAIEYDHQETALLLLEAGADAMVQGAGGVQPLEIVLRKIKEGKKEFTAVLELIKEKFPEAVVEWWAAIPGSPS